MTAAVVAPVLGLIGMSIYWAARPHGLGAVSGNAVGVALWPLLGGLLLALAVHVDVGRFGPAPLLQYRPLLSSALGGVTGSLLIAWLMALVKKVV